MGFVAPILGIAGLALSAVGGVEKAQGAIVQSQAQASSYSYQAQIAKNNAALSEQSARWSADEGDIEATNEGLRTAAEIGTMKAHQAASGIDVNTGSALSAREAADRIGMINAMTYKSNYARQAWGYQVQQSNEEAQSALYKKAGAYATEAGKMGASDTMLATAGTLASDAEKMSTSGALQFPTISTGPSFSSAPIDTPVAIGARY